MSKLGKFDHPNTVVQPREAPRYTSRRGRTHLNRTRRTLQRQPIHHLPRRRTKPTTQIATQSATLHPGTASGVLGPIPVTGPPSSFKPRNDHRIQCWGLCPFGPVFARGKRR
jgi:hypothetical protein